MYKEETIVQEEVNSQLLKTKTPQLREINGLILFLSIFAFIIPYLLSKLGNNFILLYYFSNLDLIANILNHWNKYFDNLYFPNPISGFSFISSTIINFFALLGVSTIVATLSLKYKSVFYGMAAATTSLLITYLLPTTFIYIIMLNIEDYISKNYNKDLSNTISVIVGILLSFLCVFSEVVLSQKYLGNLASFYETIYQLFIQ